MKKSKKIKYKIEPRSFHDSIKIYAHNLISHRSNCLNYSLNFILLTLVFFVSANLNSQNLVPNPSFEASQCPLNWAELNQKASPWTNINGASPDLFARCGGSEVGVPRNFMGAEQPRSGDYYAGFFCHLTGLPEMREYIGVPFSQPLLANQSYCISLSISVAEKSKLFFTTLGIHISDTILSEPFLLGNPLNINPTYEHNSLLNNMSGWQTISFNYIAHGGETFISIGNFKDDSNSGLVSNPSGTEDIAYLYIDDVSVVPILNSIIDLGNDTTICGDIDFILNAGSQGLSYLWQDGSTDSTYNATSPGTYFVAVTTQCGIINDTIVIGSLPGPSIDIFGDDTTLCLGDSLILDATNINDPFVWQDGSSNNTFTVTSNGLYHISVTTSCGVVSDSIFVSYNNLPSVNLGSDTAVCGNFSKTLIAGNSRSNYLWNDGSTDSVLTINSTGIYWVAVSNLCGSDIDSIIIDSISVSNFKVFGNDTALCSGESLTLDASIISDPFVWQDGSNNNTFVVNSEGTYFISTTTNCGDFSDSIFVAIIDYPKSEKDFEVFFCFSENPDFSISSTIVGQYYNWFENGFDTSNHFIVSTEGVIEVKVAIDTACAVIQQIEVKEACESYLMIPNAFSPNGDGKNDFFLPVVIDAEEFEFNIFNRWGELIYNGKNGTRGWDGKYLGHYVQQDVYICQLTMKGFNKKNTLFIHEEIAKVTLLR